MSPPGADVSLQQDLPRRVSVLLPVYSETDLLLRTIADTRASLVDLLEEFLIVVAPQYSPECLNLCRRLPQIHPDIRTWIQSDRAGIGWAYREAIPHMRGTHGLLMASDLETDPADARRLADKALDRARPASRPRTRMSRPPAIDEKTHAK